MNAVFADTSFWIALLNPRDDLHQKAREVAASLGEARVVTTQMVLVELLNDFASRGPALRNAASVLVRRLAQNRRTIIVPQSGEQFDAAVALYAERRDKNWSLTDCASLLVMKAESIQRALTHDRHFEQMGFEALLRPAPSR